MKINKPLSKKYRPALRFAVITQLVAIVFAVLSWDSFQIYDRVVLAMIAYWILAILLLSLRPVYPTKPDLLAIRWGFVLCAILVGLSRFLLSK